MVNANNGQFELSARDHITIHPVLLITCWNHMLSSLDIEPLQFRLQVYWEMVWDIAMIILQCLRRR